jgi:hypothetical protein
MPAKKRMKDIREAKDKRAKKLAIGGAVLLVAVLAFEVPKVMKHGGSSATPPATTTTATGAPATGTPATTATGTAAAAVLPTSGGSTTLPNDSAEVPRASKSQLFIFSHFSGKDPFVQQVSDAAAAPSGSGAAPTITGVPAQTAAAVTHNSGSNAVSAPQTSSARTLAKTGAVAISVNGQVQTIRIGGSFPSSNPLFRLVSVSHGVARIGIANGSYASGTQTVSLTAGRTLTLVDTSDGARYKLRLA